MRYTILLHPEDEGGFSVTVPALDGCVTQGDTFVDAVENARDAIEGHLAVLAQHGWEIPIERHPLVPVSLDVEMPVIEPAHAA
jgi:predicted RNase H-like HicB family nuclease